MNVEAELADMRSDTTATEEAIADLRKDLDLHFAAHLEPEVKSREPKGSWICQECGKDWGRDLNSIRGTIRDPHVCYNNRYHNGCGEVAVKWTPAEAPRSSLPEHHLPATPSTNDFAPAEVIGDLRKDLYLHIASHEVCKCNPQDLAEKVAVIDKQLRMLRLSVGGHATRLGKLDDYGDTADALDAPESNDYDFTAAEFDPVDSTAMKPESVCPICKEKGVPQSTVDPSLSRCPSCSCRADAVLFKHAEMVHLETDEQQPDTTYAEGCTVDDLGEHPSFEPQGHEVCPFCGDHKSEIWNLQDQYENPIDYYVTCLSCGGQGAYSETPESAVAEWNRRAMRTPLVHTPSEYDTQEDKIDRLKHEMEMDKSTLDELGQKYHNNIADYKVAIGRYKKMERVLKNWQVRCCKAHDGVTKDKIQSALNTVSDKE